MNKDFTFNVFTERIKNKNNIFCHYSHLVFLYFQFNCFYTCVIQFETLSNF